VHVICNANTPAKIFRKWQISKNFILPSFVSAFNKGTNFLRDSIDANNMQSTVDMKACNVIKNRYNTKYLVFLLPIQMPIQGQWWSWFSIQTPHSLQWNDLGGLIILQVEQNANG
jgi:hypothetical protein